MFLAFQAVIIGAIEYWPKFVWEPPVSIRRGLTFFYFWSIITVLILGFRFTGCFGFLGAGSLFLLQG